MKLLNREPTEEMIKAACAHYTHDDYTGPTSTFRAMYDSAPEIPIDMEPVKFSDHPDLVGGIMWSECELRFINERDKKWSAITASLQAKNERLTAERDELMKAIHRALSYSMDDLGTANVLRDALAKYEGEKHD